MGSSYCVIQYVKIDADRFRVLLVCHSSTPSVIGFSSTVPLSPQTHSTVTVPNLSRSTPVIRHP